MVITVRCIRVEWELRWEGIVEHIGRIETGVIEIREVIILSWESWKLAKHWLGEVIAALHLEWPQTWLRWTLGKLKIFYLKMYSYL